MPRPLNINLQDRFGNLVVIALVGTARKGEKLWLCQCDCGNTCERVTSRLPLGGACGCRRGKNVKKVVHGMWRTPEFRAWMAMQDRCYRLTAPNHKYYEHVSVWDGWKGPSGFMAFYEHVGPRPSPKHSLDRYPNKFGNYEPGNVRWATLTEQNRNKRNNVLLTLNGKTATVSEWAEITGINKRTISYRKKRGLSDKQALTIPVDKGRKLSNG